MSQLTINMSCADGFELMIIIVATFGQALSGQAPAVGIIGVLVVWRFIVSAEHHVISLLHVLMLLC